jgi:hypothetical protein
VTAGTRPAAEARQHIEHFAGKRAPNGLPPLIAFICGLLLIASQEPHGFASVVNPATFARWDAGQYIAIASHGYFMRPHCINGHNATGPHACSDLGWFAGYPLIMRALSVTGIGLEYAGLIVAWIFWYLALLMIWLLSKPAAQSSARRSGTPGQWVCVLIAAVFPGQIYFAAIFPLSMACLGMLACCYWSARNPDWRLAAVAGLVAGSAYLPAVAVIPGLLAAAVVTRKREARTAMCLGAAGVAAGVAGVLAYAQAAVGRWDEYFTSESAGYGVGEHNPLATLSARFSSFPAMLGSGSHRAIAEQGILVALLLALALAGFAASTRKGVQAVDVVLVIAAVAGWLIPYIAGGHLSVYRDEAMMFVLVPLLRHLPTWSLVVPLLAATWVAAGMAALFFGNVLV